MLSGNSLLLLSFKSFVHDVFTVVPDRWRRFDTPPDVNDSKKLKFIFIDVIRKPKRLGTVNRFKKRDAPIER